MNQMEYPKDFLKRLSTGSHADPSNEDSGNRGIPIPHLSLAAVFENLSNRYETGSHEPHHRSLKPGLPQHN